MLAAADLILTARTDDGLLVGISRAITDFSYCTYLSDLAVDQAFQRQGIGRELIARTHEAAGSGTSAHPVGRSRRADLLPAHRHAAARLLLDHPASAALQPALAQRDVAFSQLKVAGTVPCAVAAAVQDAHSRIKQSLGARRRKQGRTAKRSAAAFSLACASGSSCFRTTRQFGNGPRYVLVRLFRPPGARTQPRLLYVPSRAPGQLESFPHALGVCTS